MSVIDVEIGRRLRALRGMNDMSTETLAARIGVTRRQMHRYEAGSDRLSASRLFGLAQILDVPIGAFFETVRPAADEPGRELGFADGRGFKLAQDFDKLPEAQKRAILSLVQSLSFMRSAWDEPRTSRQRDGS